MLTLYQAEWCPYCHSVRQVMTELGLAYTAVNVPAAREERADLVAVSGQDVVPVLQDGDKVFSGSGDIIEHLRNTYPAPQDALEHAALGAWRFATQVELAPSDAVGRLQELLQGEGFTVVAQMSGPQLSERLPEEYVLLQVSMPVAAAKAVETDPLAPVAVTLPIAVMPADGGSVVAAADPVGQVWLYAKPALNKVQSAVKQRLVAALEGMAGDDPKEE